MSQRYHDGTRLTINQSALHTHVRSIAVSQWEHDTEDASLADGAFHSN